jgi:hypothetical protein
LEIVVYHRRGVYGAGTANTIGSSDFSCRAVPVAKSFVQEPTCPGRTGVDAMLYVMYFLFSLVAGWLGRKRQFGFWGFFLAALLFTPPVVLLVWALTSPMER